MTVNDVVVTLPISTRVGGKGTERKKNIMAKELGKSIQYRPYSINTLVAVYCRYVQRIGHTNESSIFKQS